MKWTRVTTVSDLEQWHGVHEAAYAYDFTALPAGPIGEFRPLLENELSGGKRRELWLGTDGAPVVAALLELPVHDNLEEAEIELSVAPATRRRGFGAEAVGRLADRCRELGRVRQVAMVPGPLGGGPSPARAFAASVGFVEKLAVVRRLFDTAAVDDVVLDRLESEARPYTAGYRLEQFVDRVAPDLVDGLAMLAGRMSTDPPMGDLEHEPEVWDAKRWLAGERDALDRGRLRVGTVALSPTGEVVAYTDMGVSRARPAVGDQWDTIVRADHRGHRLGMLVKVTNLRLLQDRSPETRWVNTWNAVSNQHMIAINEVIGWRPVDAWAECQRTI